MSGQPPSRSGYLYTATFVEAQSARARISNNAVAQWRPPSNAERAEFNGNVMTPAHQISLYSNTLETANPVNHLRLNSSAVMTVQLQYLIYARDRLTPAVCLAT